MAHRARTARISLLSILTLGAAQACSNPGPLSGDRIVRDLERRSVAIPDEEGRPASAPAPADLPPTGPITLADLLRVAESRNPELASARSDVGIAAGQAWQASLYPNPRLDAGAEDVSFDDGFNSAKTTVGVTQPFILGDRRRAAMRAADAAQAARMAEVDAERRALFGEVAALHAHLLSIRDQRALYRELHDLADQTLDAARTRFEARAAPETDVIRPRVEVARIEAALARLARDQAASARRLELLLGDVPLDISRLDGTIPTSPAPLDADELAADIRSAHPALLAADREIDAAAARLARVHAENTPDLDVRLATGYRAESDDGILEFGAGMTLPLWDQRQGDAMSARFELMRARQQRTATEHDLLSRLADALGEYDAARAELATFRDAIAPDAHRAFDLTGEGYRAGRSSFLDLLDAQRTLTEARVTLVELAASAAAARARVIQIVGAEAFHLQATPATTPEPTDPTAPENTEDHR